MVGRHRAIAQCAAACEVAPGRMVAAGEGGRPLRLAPRADPIAERPLGKPIKGNCILRPMRLGLTSRRPIQHCRSRRTGRSTQGRRTMAGHIWESELLILGGHLWELIILLMLVLAGVIIWTTWQFVVRFIGGLRGE
jgi:hypothetical protein